MGNCFKKETLKDGLIDEEANRDQRSSNGGNFHEKKIISQKMHKLQYLMFCCITIIYFKRIIFSGKFKIFKILILYKFLNSYRKLYFAAIPRNSQPDPNISATILHHPGNGWPRQDSLRDLRPKNLVVQRVSPVCPQVQSNALHFHSHTVQNNRSSITRTPSSTLSASIVSQSSNQNVITINGQVQYNNNKTISTNVFEGVSSGRKVAVKIDQASRIDQEIKILSTLDHQNILRFIFDCSINGREKVLISELYERPLSDCSKLQIDLKSIMHQLASSVEYLQRKKIMHLDVSPGNIFFVKRDIEYVVKLTNFGKAENVISEVYYRNDLIVDVEYSAPELKQHLVCPSSDIYSLGKVFIFLMIKMGHGKAQQTKGRGKKIGIIPSLEVNQLKNDSNDIVLCKNMIEKMLVTDPKARIDGNNILKHPFFWSAQQSRDFILEISKMLEGSSNDFRTELYKGSFKVMGGKDAEWTGRITNKLLEELKKARKAYCTRTGATNDEIDGKKITSLINTIRNMIVHTKTAEVTAIVGSDDETFIKYWTSRFPNLILHLWETKVKYDNKEN